MKDGSLISTEIESVAWQNRVGILKHVWLLALPVILTNLLQTVVTVVDTFMVGRLDSIAIAAGRIAGFYACLGD